MLMFLQVHLAVFTCVPTASIADGPIYLNKWRRRRKISQRLEAGNDGEQLREDITSEDGRSTNASLSEGASERKEAPENTCYAADLGVAITGN